MSEKQEPLDANERIEEFYETLVESGLQSLRDREPTTIQEFIESMNVAGQVVTLAGDGIDIPQEILDEHPDFKTSGEIAVVIRNNEIQLYQGIMWSILIPPSESRALVDVLIRCADVLKQLTEES